MEHNDKIKKAFWITEDMDREIDIHLKLDNCSSRSEFVMNALKFYVGYLNTKNASAFLPEVLSATLTGTLDGFAGRISSLLFKQGVDINLMAQIIAYDTDIDEGAYERLRGKAIRDMKLPEADYFMEEFLPSYGLTIEEQDYTREAGLKFSESSQMVFSKVLK